MLQNETYMLRNEAIYKSNMYCVAMGYAWHKICSISKVKAVDDNETVKGGQNEIRKRG